MLKLAHCGTPQVSFSRHSTAGLLTHATRSELFCSAASAAGLPKSTNIHTLRHSAASMMIDNGTHLKVVSDVLGHASIAITADTYGHLYPTQVRDAMDALSDALD